MGGLPILYPYIPIDYPIYYKPIMFLPVFFHVMSPYFWGLTNHIPALYQITTATATSLHVFSLGGTRTLRQSAVEAFPWDASLRGLGRRGRLQGQQQTPQKTWDKSAITKKNKRTW